MERIVYNKTLDTHKAGVQFTLQGFETADKLSRRIVISLMANGDAIDLPLGQLEAVMYVNTPSGAEPSINACIIKGNTIIYDVLPITEEGITTMQLKLIEASGDGKPTVLATPRFAVEVIKSDTDDESIKDSVAYTAVEKALSIANAAYGSRLERIALNSDCMFYAYYADGTIYESDVLKEIFLEGDVLLSQSYAKGGSGVRDGEDTDNSMYYSQVAKSMALETKASGEDALAILDEVKKHGVYTLFSANFETGELVYESPKYDFEIDKESGELNIIGKAYSIEENMVYVIEEWLKEFGVAFPAFKESVDKNAEDISELGETSKQHEEKLNKLGGTELWTNPDPTVDFLEQTIEIDLTEYESIKILLKETTSSRQYFEVELSFKGYEYHIPCLTDSRFRRASFSNDGIWFAGGYTSSNASNASQIIPVKIIGYKY